MSISTREASFKCHSTKLTELLDGIDHGKIQLPDFQRDWVWKEDGICNLVASVSLAYPIGAILLLEINTDEINFKRRTIWGVPENNNNPEHLILDGQQRLTSLYISLFSQHAISVKKVRGNKKEKRFFYLDIEECLKSNYDHEDAIFSVSEDRKQKSAKNKLRHDIDSPEKEYEGKFFPLNAFVNESKVNNWIDNCKEYYKGKKEFDVNKNILNSFRDNTIKIISNYEVPVITLKKSTPKEAICQVFVKVNQGGVELKTFELLTAMYASRGDFNLREDWDDSKKELNIDTDSSNVLNGVDENSFIQAITLLSNHKDAPDKNPGCKNNDMLKMSVDSYKKNKKYIIKGFQEAKHFLESEEKISSNMLPYNTQLIPLAVICAIFDKRLNSVKKNIKQWYWHGVFSEAYASAVETRFSNDIFQMYDWIENNKRPLMFQRSINIDDILRSKTRLSAVYKGVIALLDKEGSQDFIRKYEAHEAEQNFGIHVHHIFPRKYCTAKKYDKEKIESIVNKTRILPETNKEIAGNPPSKYIKDIQKMYYGNNEEKIESVLKTHSIDYAFLVKDDFDGFILDRAKRLSKLIENVVGKSFALNDEAVKKIFNDN